MQNIKMSIIIMLVSPMLLICGIYTFQFSKIVPDSIIINDLKDQCFICAKSDRG